MQNIHLCSICTQFLFIPFPTLNTLITFHSTSLALYGFSQSIVLIEFHILGNFFLPPGSVQPKVNAWAQKLLHIYEFYYMAGYCLKAEWPQVCSFLEILMSSKRFLTRCCISKTTRYFRIPSIPLDSRGQIRFIKIFWRLPQYFCKK